MSDRELRKPSTWLISGGVGVAFAGIRFLSDLSVHQTDQAAYYAVLAITVTGSMLALIQGGYGLLLFLLWLPSLLREWGPILNRPKPPASPPPAPTVTYTRIVTGTVRGKPAQFEMTEQRPARWARWQDTALTVMDWYNRTGTLIYAAMVGKGRAWQDNEQARIVFAEMDRVGLVRLINGQPTRLRDTEAAIRATIESGKVEWTDESDPPKIRPAPPPLVIGHVPAGESSSLSQSS